MTSPDTPVPAGDRRIQLLAALVFAAIIVVVAVVVLGGRQSGHKGTPGDRVPGETETRQLLTGVRQDGVTLGDPKAPVTIIEFVDLQCPFCAAHQIDVQPKVVSEVVRSGEAKISMQPLAFLGPDSRLGRAVYLRLAEQGHGWEFLNLAFWNQGAKNSAYMTPAWLQRMTAGIPGVTEADLERPTLKTERIDPTLRRGIDEAERLKRTLMKPGDGTPYVAVGRTGAPLREYRKVDADAASIRDAVRELR
jgi:hypothetical protein